MNRLTRRAALGALGGTALATLIGNSPTSAAPATHTLWTLNPAWGTPLTTTTGSDTKSRCRGNACHRAAPHRFFLSEADAVAGRLHPCCLAQPEAVQVCVDLNQLMPYYRARRGGVDGRCPELPADIRAALYNHTPCTTSAPATPTAALPETGGNVDGVLLAGAAAITALGTAAIAISQHRTTD